MKKTFIPILIIMTAIFGTCPLNGETRIYEEKTGDRLTIHHFQIETTSSGYNVTLRSETSGSLIEQRYELDTNLSALSWAFDNPAENTKVAAHKEGNNIYLSGIHKGKQIKKVFKINALPWNQSFNIGLEKFALSPLKTIKFWAIGTSGPGDMKITTFSVKKKEVENIRVGGKKEAAVHLQISLSGLLSIFWKGNYYYSRTDGTFLLYMGKGRGSAPTVMERIREKIPLIKDL